MVTSRKLGVTERTNFQCFLFRLFTIEQLNGDWAI